MSEPGRPAVRDDAGARRICVAFACAQLLLHFAINRAGGYGYFRDEFYYLACSARPAAGYVDQPPLSILLLGLQRALIGDGVFALRVLPALAGAATVWLTGRLAQRLGASRFGVALACLACLCSPTILAFTGFYSMNALDLVVWIGAGHLLVGLLEDPRTRSWVALGVVCGLGLSNKINAGWLVAGIFVGLLATPYRRLLRTPGPWIAAGIALALFAPYVVWNLQNDLAHLEFIRAASEGKYSGLSAQSFLLGLIPGQHPLNAPIWALGLYFYFGARDGARFRPLGWIWVTTCAVLVLHGNSKSEYLSSAFPLLFAAGGAASDLARQRWIARGLKPVYAGLLLVTTVAIAPFALPILPVETYVRYAERLGQEPGTSEDKELGRLGQFYADMFGWQEQVDAVARAYERLTPDERADCAIFASNYGRCGAIDLLGRSRGLPDSIGGHNNYWIWGPRGHTGELVLVLGADLGGREEMFESTQVVEQAAHSEYAMPYENDLKVFLCRGLKRPLSELWPELKHYD